MSLLTLLRSFGPPIDANPAVAVPTTAEIATALAAAPGALAPNLITQITSAAQVIPATIGLAIIDHPLTNAELAGTADVNLLNAQTGRIIWPLYAWVSLSTTAVAPSAGKTGSICFPSSAGNSHTGVLCTGVGNQTQVRTWDAAEANLGTLAQALSQPLVLRSTSAAITPNGATCRLFVACLLVTP